MLVSDRILWLRDRVAEQETWIKRCGGNLAGYIANYGDPGIPPLENGKPKVLTVPLDKSDLFTDFVRAPGGTATSIALYAKHSGDGGTAIFKADYNRLISWRQELANLESRNHSARRRADITMASNIAQTACLVEALQILPRLQQKHQLTRLQFVDTVQQALNRMGD